MTQLGDYHVKQPTSGSSDGKSRGPTVAIAVILLLAIGFGVYWYLSPSSDGEPAEVAADMELPVTTPPPAAVELDPDPEPIELPTLDGSDAFVRDLVGALSSHPGLASWLVPNGMVRRVVVVVDNVASGNNPSQHLGFMQSDTSFGTMGDGATLRVNPTSYARYDAHAAIIDALDVHGTAEAYATLEPLMNEAYAELGYPDTPFSRGLERAITHLLQVPDLREPPSLVERAPFFNFADPTLESLTAAQKQFLGMGPQNVRTVQAKLRQIAIAIGIPDRRLP